MGVRVDESRSNHQTAGVDGARRPNALLGGVTNKYDPIAPQADVRRNSRRTGSVDDLAAKDQEIQLLRERG